MISFAEIGVTHKHYTLTHITVSSAHVAQRFPTEGKCELLQKQ